MALLDSEVMRIKFHLGFNLLSIGAEPRIDHVALFDQVIKPYVDAGAKTTSSTAVTAAEPAAPVSITLASVVGFTAGDRVVVDVDSLTERSTIRSLSGSAISVVLALAHTGTYPVTIEGPESIIRDLLMRCDRAWTTYTTAIESGGLEQLGKGGEIRWYPEAGGGGPIGAAATGLARVRIELGKALGVAPLSGSGGSLSVVNW